MSKLLYRLQCALYLKHRAKIPFLAAWEVSESIMENEPHLVGMSPKDAADEELSCWAD